MILTAQHRLRGCSAGNVLEWWVVSKLGSIDHERRVSRNASTLFDLTHPRHHLGAAERRLLRQAAMIHDVGRCIDDETHPEEGARMILETHALPLEPAQRRALAYLTRHHRGKVPLAGEDAILAHGDDHQTLRLLLGLLRSADALDSRTLQTPRLTIQRIGRRIQATCSFDDPTPRVCKTYGRKKKHRLLEELLDVKVEVRIAPAGLLRRVA